MANESVARVNFHGGGSGAYTWFGPFSESGAPEVRPLFYGMLLFSRFAAGARIVELRGAPSPATCEDGILGGKTSTGQVCCAASCGVCGGAGCAQLPGGAENCCGGGIEASGKICEDADDVACMLGNHTGARFWAAAHDGGSNSSAEVTAHSITTSSPRPVRRRVVAATRRAGTRLLAAHKNSSSTAESVRVVVGLAADGRRLSSSTAPNGAGAANATLSILSAPDGFAAKTGLRLAGQTFDGSVAGELVGEFAPVSVAPEDGAYAFDLAPGTAALLEIPGDTE